jgi:Zn-dependent peptidase ImmA (M78 family)
MQSRLKELYDLADDNKIAVYYFPFESIVSVSERIDGKEVIGIDTDKITAAEELMYVAHEMGHCMRGYFYTEDTPLVTRSICERRAEIWSIKKLVPKDELIEALEQGITEVWELAERFNIPDDFMVKALQYYGYM